MLTQKNDGYVDVWLDIKCHSDRTHTLGRAALHLAPHPRAGEILLSNGAQWDEFDKVSLDCPQCAVTGQGNDQRISKRRLTERFDEILASGKHSGDLLA